MKKEYLPHRISREGVLPDRLVLAFYPGGAELCRKECLAKNKTVHYHVSTTGEVTVFTPLSAGANLHCTGRREREEISEKCRDILILLEGDGRSNGEEEEALIRLLKGIQKEFFRLYGQPFPWERKHLICPPSLSAELLLEEGFSPLPSHTLFRVQTGNYRSLRDAEDSVERLQKAGIAAYITEIPYP